MKRIILFDQDLQPYRESVYRIFAEEFKKMGYELIVLYDGNLNKRSIEGDNMLLWLYSFSGFVKGLKKYRPEVIIQFVWLRYFFLFPFMVYSRLAGKKIILWSHGINLQKRDQNLMNQLYYLRQRLANALVIYHEDQLQYVVKQRPSVFIANNTLNFNEFAQIQATKEKRKEKYGFEQKQVLLCIGRMNMNNTRTKTKLIPYFLWYFIGRSLVGLDRIFVKDKNLHLLFDDSHYASIRETFEESNKQLASLLGKSIIEYGYV